VIELAGGAARNPNSIPAAGVADPGYNVPHLNSALLRSLTFLEFIRH
jgi:hypothetical protein